MLFLLAVPLMVVAVLLGCLSHLIRRHGPGPVAWRWFSGHPLDGKWRTNATWLHPATRVLHQSGNAVRWHHLPRLHRAGIRAGATIAAGAALAGLATDRQVTLAALASAAAGAAAWGTWRGLHALRAWRHRRMWVLPLHRALGPVLAIPPGERPSSWLQVEPDRSGATITLPSTFANRQSHRAAIHAAVTAKLALESPKVDWDLAGPRPVVRFTAKPAPPPKVVLDDLRQVIETSPDTDLVLGLGRGRQPVTVSLDGDSPHLMLSMGSGAGKSALGRLIGAQALFRGCVLMIWDYKLISQNWAKGLPGVVYCKTEGEIHAAALWLQAEIGRRNKVADAAADVEGRVHADVGPRIIVLCEEMNATMARLRAYWRQCKAPSDPDRSPAVEAIDESLFLGRQVRANIVMVGQMVTARTAGSSEGRENIGVRILARNAWNAWKMLVPEVYPMPPSSNQPGRVQVVTAGTARETQTGFLTGHQARQLALSGTVSPWPSKIPGYPHLVSVTVPAVENPGPDQGSGQLGQPRPAPPEEGVRLSDAVALGVVHGRLAAIRKATHRDPAFPRPVAWQGTARLYDPEQLQDWERARDRSLNRKDA